MCIQLYSQTTLPHQWEVVPTRCDGTFRQELPFLVSHSVRAAWNLERHREPKLNLQHQLEAPSA